MITSVSLASLAVLWLGPGSPDGVERADFEQALVELERSNELANENAPNAAEALTSALAALHEFAPELARDLDAREQRLLAQLNLARVYMVRRRDFLANEMMDEAIRVALGADIPAARLGPKLEALYLDRREALAHEGSAQLKVECTTPCKVYVNEQLTGTEIRGLALGTYHVWVEDSHGLQEPKYEQITLSAAGERFVFPYGPGPASFEPRELVEPSEARVLPRWAEIAITTVGAGLVVAGGTVLAFQGHCPGGLDPIADALDCPRVYETRAVGGVLAGLGAASVLTGGVLLTVDEVRHRGREGAQVMATWTFAF